MFLTMTRPWGEMSLWSGTPSVADDEHTLTQAQQCRREPAGSDTMDLALLLVL